MSKPKPKQPNGYTRLKAAHAIALQQVELLKAENAALLQARNVEYARANENEIAVSKVTCDARREYSAANRFARKIAEILCPEPLSPWRNAKLVGPVSFEVKVQD